MCVVGGGCLHTCRSSHYARAPALMWDSTVNYVASTVINLRLMQCCCGTCGRAASAQARHVTRQAQMSDMTYRSAAPLRPGCAAADAGNRSACSAHRLGVGRSLAAANPFYLVDASLIRRIPRARGAEVRRPASRADRVH